MDQRRDFVDLALLSGVPMAELCRRFGISRQTGYVWRRRGEAILVSGAGAASDGAVDRLGGLDLGDRSRRPHGSPLRLGTDREAAILAVRDAHPAWGARKIAAILAADGHAVPAVSTVHAVLVRHGRIVDPPGGGPALGSFEREAPNALWQMDFKGRVRLACGTWCHPLTLIDDHSRYAVGLYACADQQTATVRNRMQTAFRQHGLPEAIYVDNGAPWGGGTPGQWTPLRLWLLKLGVETIHARPYHPQGRGKNERFHRSLKAEVFEHAILRGLGQAQDAFDDWRRVYNRRRPHQALGLGVPASRYVPSPRPFPETLPEPGYDGDDIIRRVGTTKAYISWRGRPWKLPAAFAGERVAIRPTETDGKYAICYGAHRIAIIDLNPTNRHPHQL